MKIARICTAFLPILEEKTVRWPKNMKKNFYDHEHFSKCKEVGCGFKNAKKIKIILGTFSKYFLKISIYYVFLKNLGLIQGGGDDKISYEGM